LLEDYTETMEDDEHPLKKIVDGVAAKLVNLGSQIRDAAAHVLVNIGCEIHALLYVFSMMSDNLYPCVFAAILLEMKSRCTLFLEWMCVPAVEAV
jgi:hypothetical protein